MTQALSLGLVGAGAIAQAYAQALEQCSETWTLVAVADVKEDAAIAMSERLHARVYTDYKQLTATEDLDAVVICTPPNTHPEIVTHFLRHKVHVLCEKPFCIEEADARRMAEVAREEDVLLTMASKFRYVEDSIKARSIIASGTLGDLLLFENVFTSRVDMSTRWNADARISGGGVLIDNGTHSLDIMRFFLGELAEVQVIEGPRSQGLSVDETVHIFARSRQGVMGRVDLSWSFHKELPYFVAIYGTEGTLQIGWRESRYKQHSNPDWIVFGTGYDKVQAFRSQLQNLAAAIQDQAPLLIGVTDAIASVQAVQAAYRSLHANNWVSLPATEA